MKEFPRLLIADENNIYDVPFLQATGMKAGKHFSLEPSDLIKLHPDSELFMLPERSPVAFEPETGEYARLENDPFSKKKKPCYAVAAFVSPGHTTTYSASYAERKKTPILPLFSYASVAYYKGAFYTAAVKVDKEKRQELAGMDLKLMEKNIKKFRKTFSKNRLVRHLERCAQSYCCPAARNFFLKRYEAPLPTSPSCNARCIGCISHQPDNRCSVTQPRIEFIPTPEEIAEVALFHIADVKDPVVSFGQGCEGEPLMVGDVLLEAVKLIRKRTGKGIINLNTNASKPDVIKRLFDSGLDSVRVSMNSTREKYYNAYYKPCDYTFGDVVKAISNAKKAGGFVSINYLVMPGFTDSKAEAASFGRFIDKTGIDMIQWRNLNYDPMAYFRELKIDVKAEEMIGVKELIDRIHGEHPHLVKGYFNPSKGRIQRKK